MTGSHFELSPCTGAAARKEPHFFNDELLEGFALHTPHQIIVSRVQPAKPYCDQLFLLLENGFKMGTDRYERRTTAFQSVPVLQVHAKRGRCGKQSSWKRPKTHKQRASSQLRPLATSSLGDRWREKGVFLPVRKKRQRSLWMQMETDCRVGCQTSLPRAAGETPDKPWYPGRQQPALQPASEALQLLHGSSFCAFQQLCSPPAPAHRAGGLGWGLKAFSQPSNLTAPVGMFTARCHLKAYRPPSLSPTAPA